MSPIFVRPVREQLEHDRLIRHLQVRYKRKFEVGINVGDEQTAPVKIGANTFFPDLVLTSGKRLAGLVEVETGESINNLEAMAQWTHFSHARVPFHLYVPVPGFDAARRLCAANQAKVAEIWTYRPAVEGFDLVRMFHDSTVSASHAERTSAAKPAPPKPVAATPVAKPAAAPVAPAKKPPEKKATPKPAPKPAPKAASKPAPKPAAKPAKKKAPKAKKPKGRSR